MEVYRILFIVTVGDYLVPWPTRREPSAIYRHLSPSIAPKRNFLAADLTVSPAYAREKSHNFRCLHEPETIEWE
jgi:hypothetical protein